jgi:hypothetical protein
VRGSSTGAAIGGALGSLTPLGPLGAVIGGALGSAIGGLLKSSKSGWSTINTNASGSLYAAADGGKSAAVREAAAQQANGVVTALSTIANQLGAKLAGGLQLGSIGQSKGKFTFDPTPGTAAGQERYASAEEAQKAAIGYALQHGVIAGISDAAKRILASGQDLDAALQKAVSLESIPKLLAARLDPVGAAVDALNKKYADLIAIMDESGASAEQRADAEKLYRLELTDAKASATSAAQSLKDLNASFKLGSSSPFSLRDQEAAAKAALDPYLSQINAGVTIDQQKYIEAAQAFLDVERQLNGSTQAFFDAQATIQAATSKAISTIDNATPIKGATVDPFAAKTADNTQATAEILAQQTGLLLRIATAVESGDTSGLTDFLGAARGF